MPYLDNHLITLNSSDAIKLNSTYLSNVVFPFKGLLKDDVNIIRSYVTLINAQIPVSFYIIDATNNVLSYNYNNQGQVNITVPIGNYNATSLCAYFNTYFAGVSLPITVSISSITGCLTWKSTGLQWVLYPNGQRLTTMSLILGFTATITPAYNLVMPYPLNLLGKNKLFINSSNLNNVAYTSHNTGFSTCITTIPINVPPYGLIQYSSLTDQNKNILINRVLDTIDIQILDLDNNYINFNNVNWSITLCLSIEKMDANKFHIQSFNNYLGDYQPIQPKEIELNPPENDKELEFLMK